MADQLSDLQERLARLGRSGAAECPIRRMLNDLDEETAKVVEDAIMNPDIPYTSLTYELRHSGVPTSKESIRFHRNGACTCPRPEVASE